MSDWLPSKRTERLAMAKTWSAMLTASGLSWGILEGEIVNLNTRIAKAQELLGAAQSGSRTKVITAQCNQAFDSLGDYMRDLKKRKFFVPPLSMADLISLGLTPPDTNPTPISAPTAQVEADMTFPGIHLVELKNIRPVGGAVPDSKSDYGVRIYWGIMGPVTAADKFRLSAAPSNGGDLPHSKFTRRRKEFFDFDGESGNAIFFCLRYENPTGQAGPFGPMLKAVIP